MGLGFWEILTTLLVALLVIRPQDLPRLIHRARSAYRGLVDLYQDLGPGSHLSGHKAEDPESANPADGAGTKSGSMDNDDKDKTNKAKEKTYVRND